MTRRRAYLLKANLCLLLSITLSSCALIQLPLTILQTAAHLAGRWKDEDGRVYVLRENNTFEVANNNEQKVFGRYLVKDTLVTFSTADQENKETRIANISRTATYKLQLNADKLKLVALQDNEAKRTQLFPSLDWHRD
jgi:hypothetical protein